MTDGTLTIPGTGAGVNGCLPDMSFRACPIYFLFRTGDHIIRSQGSIPLRVPLGGNFRPEGCQAVFFIRPKIGTVRTVGPPPGAIGNGGGIFLAAVGANPPDFLRRTAQYRIGFIGILRAPLLCQFWIFYRQGAFFSFVKIHLVDFILVLLVVKLQRWQTKTVKHSGNHLIQVLVAPIKAV